MTPEGMRQARELFEQALQHPVGQRSAFLAGVCGGDAELRAEVESLLEHDRLAGEDFLRPLEPERPGRPGDATQAIEAAETSEIRVTGPQIEGYEVVREIGRGGQACVYQAIQETTKRRVAIKVLLEGPYAAKSAQKRFEREIELVAQLKHPNIISIFHSGTTPDGRQFYVMDFVRGMPLQHYVREKQLTLEETLELFTSVCEAVQHAHQKGVIHRDLKPTNILVDADGTPKVMDFGLAKLLAGPVETLVSISRELIGTLPYMSPEQVRGKPDEIDTRADIYALGVILYELLTGHYPYPVVGQIVDVLKHIAETPPTPPTRAWNSDSGVTARSSKRIRPGQCPIDDEVQTIVLRSLAKERGRRYQSAGELARDIHHYLDGEPLEAKRDSGWYILRKRLHKHRMPLGVTCAILLVLAGLAVGAYIRIAQERSAAVLARDEADGLRERAERETDNARREAEANRRALYFNRIALADAEYRQANIARVRKLLAECPPDLRGWEWYRLHHIHDHSIRTLRGHTDWIESVAFSPDGLVIASAGDDKTIKTWDAASGQPRLTLDGHDVVWSVDFSPDGRWLVSAGQDHTVRVWDARSGKEMLVLGGHTGPVHWAAFDPAGRRIVSAGSDSTVRLWDAETGQELRQLHGHWDGPWQRGVASAVFTPDGRGVVSGGNDGTIRLWNAATGQEERVIRKDGASYGGHVQCSADGKRIAAASGGVLELATGEQLFALEGHGGPIWDLAFSPDGQRIASASLDGTLRLWDAATGSEQKTLRGHASAVRTVAFSPDGRGLASGGQDGTVKLWDPTASPEVLTFLADGNPTSVAFSPDGQRIAASIKSGVAKVWDVTTGAELLAVGGGDGQPLWSVAFSPDGARIAAGGEDKNVRVWDAVTGQELLTLRGHAGMLGSVAFGPGGERIVSGDDDHLVKVWSALTGESLLTLRGHTGPVDSVAFSPDGTIIVSGSYDDTIRTWDAATGRELMTLRGHTHDVPAVAFSPNGERLVSGSFDKTIKLWDSATGQELMTLRGHADGVTGVAFSPDGNRILSCAVRRHTLKLWDAYSGTEILTLRCRSFGTAGVAFSPDGRRIASAGFTAGLVELYDSGDREDTLPPIAPADGNGSGNAGHSP